MKRDAALLDEPVIAPYKYARGIEHDTAENIPQHRVHWEKEIAACGGFNPILKTWAPLRHVEEAPLYAVLDHITAACEAGVVSQHNWEQQLFATPGDFEAFLEQLEGYDECYRIIDRWWMALARLAGYENCEEGFIATADMANALRDAVVENKVEQRNQVLRAEYLEAHPSKPLKLKRAEAEALFDANRVVRHRHNSPEQHFTCGIPFTNEFQFIKEKKLCAREATRADIDSVMAKAAKAKAKAK